MSKFDPRPRSLRTAEPNIANEFVRDLQSISTTCPSSWETMLPIICEDFILTEVEANIVKEQVNSMCSQLTPPTLAPVLLTSEQSSARWKNERRVRVTASNAKAICVAKSDERRGNLIRGQLWGATVSTLAMKYGVENEPVARETFATSFINKGISCVDTGMWVNGRYPGVGASPDGLLFDAHTNSWGVLEIKCPNSLQSVKCSPMRVRRPFVCQAGEGVLSAENAQWSISQNKSHLLLSDATPDHGVCEVQWGYFVVWTPLGIHCEQIVFDATFFSAIVAKLTHFHVHYLLPEFFLMKLPRRLSFVSV